MILSEVRMNLDVAQTALEEVVHGGCASDVSFLAILGDELDRAAFLGNEQAAVGQEFQRPGLIEFGDWGRDEGVGFLGAGSGAQH